jgi:four helix bundle protein
MGSASELEYQLLLARDLGLMDQSDYSRLEMEVVEAGRMLNSLLGTVGKKAAASS